MIVIDASSAIELLLNTTAGKRLSLRLRDETEIIHVPHLIDLEIAQTLRRYVLREAVHERLGALALKRWRDFDVERHSHEPLLQRIWQLRANVSAYDAVYVALAETLSTSLVTSDMKLAGAPGLSSRIELL